MLLRVDSCTEPGALPHYLNSALLLPLVGLFVLWLNQRRKKKERNIEKRIKKLLHPY
jgi:hypothetical protein